MIKIEGQTKSGTFYVFRDGEIVLTLLQAGGRKPKITSSFGGQDIEIRRKGKKKSKYDVMKRGDKWGQLELNDRSDLYIGLRRSDKTGKDLFALKRSARRESSDYGLYYKGRKPILSFRLKSNRMTNKFKVDVKELNHRFPEVAIDELLIYCGFGIHLMLDKGEDDKWF